MRFCKCGVKGEFRCVACRAIVCEYHGVPNVGSGMLTDFLYRKYRCVSPEIGLLVSGRVRSVTAEAVGTTYDEVEGKVLCIACIAKVEEKLDGEVVAVGREGRLKGTLCQVDELCLAGACMNCTVCGKRGCENDLIRCRRCNEVFCA